MKFSVGQQLRAARLDQGLDFDAVVARTKISEKFLKAIEADDRKSFPSGFFYKSFVDQYARALSLDTREIDDQLNSLLSAEAPLPLPGQNGEAPARKVPPLIATPRAARNRAYASTAVLVVVLVGCSGFYSWWRKLQQPVTAPAPAKVEAVQAPKVELAPSMPEPAPRPSEPTPVPVSLATVKADASPPSASQRVSGLLLELVAREETWLSISSDGLMVFKGTLTAHESKTVEGKEFAKLRVNNPAALEVKLNGKVLGPLGRPGQYLVVIFTRDKYHVLDSEKESD